MQLKYWWQSSLDLYSQAPYKNGFAKGVEAELFLTLQLKQRCSEVTSDLCNPDTSKELIFRRQPLKVKSLVPVENLDQKGPGWFATRATPVFSHSTYPVSWKLGRFKKGLMDPNFNTIHLPTENIKPFSFFYHYQKKHFCFETMR